MGRFRTAGVSGGALWCALMFPCISSASTWLDLKPPAPLAVFSAKDGLPVGLREDLEKRHVSSQDTVSGGLNGWQKFIDRESAEWGLLKAAVHGDREEAAQVRRTLDHALKLIDPVRGGVYQYSAQGDWDHPHDEKLTRIQAEYIRVYALAYGLWKEPAYLKAAGDIRKYLDAFQKSSEGAFFSSDRNLSTAENGAVIRALATLASVSGDDAALKEAIEVAEWALDEREIKRFSLWWNGGFTHGSNDDAGPYLNDTLSMAEAFLSLYQATADREWLARAEKSAGFLKDRFRGAAGFFTAPPTRFLPETSIVSENIRLARFFNGLRHVTGRPEYRELARHAMAYLSVPGRTDGSLNEDGLLLADWEMDRPPLERILMDPKTARALSRN
jgi:uncharacterized protein YyaL (SSP411 family)